MPYNKTVHNKAISNSLKEISSPMLHAQLLKDRASITKLCTIKEKHSDIDQLELSRSAREVQESLFRI